MSIKSVQYSLANKPELLPKAFLDSIKQDKTNTLVRSIFSLGFYALGQLIFTAICRVVVPLIFMPSIRRGRYLSEEIDDRRVNFTTFDNVNISGAVFEIEPKTQQWMIYFCPNGVPFEEVYKEQLLDAAKLNVNCLFFNYRSVGNSEGTLTRSKQLEHDAIAAVEYLKNIKKVKESDMTYITHSMGGGVASKLTKYYPKSKIINNRSYSKISDIVPLILKPIIKMARLEINAIKPFIKIPLQQKMIVYHTQDEIIRFKKSSLYGAFERHVNSKFGKQNAQEHLPLNVKLTANTANNHCYQLFGEEKKDYLAKAYQLIWGTAI